MKAALLIALAASLLVAAVAHAIVLNNGYGDWQESFGIAAALADGESPYAREHWILVGSDLPTKGTPFPSPLPPTLGLLLLPLVPLGLWPALHVWEVLNTLILLSAVALTLRLSGHSPTLPRVVWLAALAALLWDALVQEIGAREFSIAQVALVLWAWRATSLGYRILPGVLLAAACLFRPNAEVLALATLPLVRRDWRMSAALVGTAAVAALGVLALGGPDAWTGWPWGMLAARALYPAALVLGWEGAALLALGIVGGALIASRLRSLDAQVVALAVAGMLSGLVSWHAYPLWVTVPLVAALRVRHQAHSQ